MLPKIRRSILQAKEYGFLYLGVYITMQVIRQRLSYCTQSQSQRGLYWVPLFWEETARERLIAQPARLPYTGLWLTGNEGMEKNMETAIMGYIGTTIRIHSFIPS